MAGILNDGWGHKNKNDGRRPGMADDGGRLLVQGFFSQMVISGFYIIYIQAGY